MKKTAPDTNKISREEINKIKPDTVKQVKKHINRYVRKLLNLHHLVTNTDNRYIEFKLVCDKIMFENFKAYIFCVHQNDLQELGNDTKLLQRLFTSIFRGAETNAKLTQTKLFFSTFQKKI